MDLGRDWHRRLASAFAKAGTLEVRVRRDGLVGRIDVLTDRPIEVKSSSSGVAPDRVVAERPEYVEQLGMYCALLDRSVGRIVSLKLAEGGVDEVRSIDLQFRHPGRMLDEMRRRAERLRTSWDSRRSESLPRCPYFERGCEYREASVCDCSGDESEAPSLILGEVSVDGTDPEEDQRIRAELRRAASTAPPTVGRFRDLVYPRRAYFERKRPRPPVEPWVSPLESPPDAYARLVEAIEAGPVGDVARLPALTDEPSEEVASFRGDPFLVRSSRSRWPPEPAELLERFPQYALELGYRCATTGRSRGRLFWTSEGTPTEPSQVRVFSLRYSNLTPFAREWRTRLEAFRRALANETPGDLPACPAWMFERCPYRDECGCGPSEGRSQR